MLIRNMSLNSYAKVERKIYSLKLFMLGFFAVFSITLNSFIQKDISNLIKAEAIITSEAIIYKDMVDMYLNEYLQKTDAATIITYAKENLNMISK